MLQLSCCSPLRQSSAVSISRCSIRRRVIKCLSFSCTFDADTHATMQINRKPMRSTSTTGPTMTGMMRARFSGCGAAWYISVPAVKFKVVPIITWRNEKTVRLSPDESTACKRVHYSLSQLLQTCLQVVGLVGSRQSTKSKCFYVNLQIIKL